MHPHSGFDRSPRLAANLRRLCAGLILSCAALTCATSSMAADASSQTFFQLGAGKDFHTPAVETCKGTVKQVLDVTNESVLTTAVQYGTGAGGGQGGQFDPTPVLTIPNVKLIAGECINAHVSAIVGSAQTYGVSTTALFQVALVRSGAAPVAMEGHYATPYGVNSPAVATATAPDVGMFAANFYQGLDGDVPAGTYNVNVYWAGAPIPGGAIGAAFVMKLYIY